MKILLASKSDTGRSKSVSGQRLVNLYAEANPEGAKYPFTLYGTPGAKRWVQPGTVEFPGVIDHFLSEVDTSLFGSVQGMIEMGGSLYAFVNNAAYKIETDRSGEFVGNIYDGTDFGEVDRLVLAENGLQIVAVKMDGTAWVITPSNDPAASTTVAQITDPDFPLVSSVCFLDGYFIFSVKDSGEFIISSLYDGTQYDALDFATAEELPDNLVSVVSFNGGLFLPGEQSYEFYYNSGNADFPFEQIEGAVNTTRGIAARDSISQEDNTLFFLGNDRVVYRLDNYTPRRVSTHAVETAISGYTRIDNAFSFIYTQNGHKFYVLTFPSHDATWVYDISTDMWHERRSDKTRWRANCYINFASKNLIGDYTRGVIYELDLDTPHEDQSPITRIAQGSVQWADGDRVTHDMVRLDIDAGQGIDYQMLAAKKLSVDADAGAGTITVEGNTVGVSLKNWAVVELDDGTEFRDTIESLVIIGTTITAYFTNFSLPSKASAGNTVRFYRYSAPTPAGLVRTPTVIMRYSDDGGITWSSEREASAGEIGDRKSRAIWRRNGQARERIYQFTISDPIKVAITGAYLEARKGRS